MKRLVLPLVVLAVAAGPLLAQPFAVLRDPYRTTIDLNLRLYTDPLIQAELKLTDEQKAKLAKIPDDLLAKHKDAIEKEKAADKESSEKLAATRAELQKKFDTLIEKNLSAEQRKRLGQMTMQAMGVSAFRNAEIAKALALSDDYQVKLSEIQQVGTEKLQKEFPNGGFGGPVGANNEELQKYAEASRKMAQETVAKFVDTFTDEQKKKWKELTGEPWEAAAAGRATGGRGTGTPAFGPSLGRLFSPGTTVYWQNQLISNLKALDELKVEKAAREALAEGLKAIQEASRADGGGPGGFGGFNSVSRTIAMETSPAADQVLTAPQAKRLEQIRFQMSGTGVFSLNRGLSYEYVTATGGGSGPAGTRGVSPSPLLKLSLTPAQVKKIDSVLADVAAKQRELGPQRGGFGFFSTNQNLTDAQKKALEAQEKARAEYQQKVNAIEQKALADITATFDAGQKAAWKELTGEPIDVLKLVNTTSSRRGPGGFGGGPIGRGGTTTSIISQWTQEASRRMTAGEYAAALAIYDEAIRLAPANMNLLVQKASLLATCPSEWVRDGKQAVELMKKVMAETKEQTYTQFHTLAACHAEAGQFDEAVKAQEKAISMLPPPVNPDDGGFGGRDLGATLKPQYEARLKLYQEKKPFRLEPRAARPPVDR